MKTYHVYIGGLLYEEIYAKTPRQAYLEARKQYLVCHKWYRNMVISMTENGKKVSPKEWRD